MHFSVALVAALAGSAAALPSNNHLVHEKRTSLGRDWSRDTAPSSHVLPMRIALKQQNLEQLPALLDDVSNPKSANFGKHWTGEELAQKFAPSHETITAVKSWLKDAGINCKVSANRGWVEFNSTVAQAEELLKTKYHVYRRDGENRDHVGCDAYSLPGHVQEHVDFITPTVSMTELKREAAGISRRQDHSDESTGRNTQFHAVDSSVISSLHTGSSSGTSGSSGSAPAANAKVALPAVAPGAAAVKAAVPSINTTQSAPSVQTCAKGVTPACMRAMYNIPQGTTATMGNPMGIYECMDYYDQADLDSFFTTFSPEITNGTAPMLNSVDGGLGLQPDNSSVGGEAVLDLSVAYPLIYPQGVRLLSVDDPTTQHAAKKGHFDSLLDAIDGSFCSFMGGDNTTVDFTYPNTAAGGYNGTKMCGEYSAPTVLSISYGYSEVMFTPAYLTRQCLEFGKLGMAGTTVVVSSGDSGVSASFCANPTIDVSTPQFPASCPYVTTVGATMLNKNVTELSDPNAETAAKGEDGYKSGGGFSTVFPMPDYQKETVAAYFERYNKLANSSIMTNTMYNKAGRAYPDVSAIGTSVTTITNGKMFNADGTSASTPLFASLITLINEVRLNGGKGPLGFINPTLYANGQGAFRDITSGNNGGCGMPGFTALEGWDPVTGFGTPMWEPLQKLLVSV